MPLAAMARLGWAFIPTSPRTCTNISLLCPVASRSARPALTLPWGVLEGPSEVSSTRPPGPAPEDSLSLLTFAAGGRDTPRGTTEINTGRGRRGQARAGPGPGAAALLAPGGSAGRGDGGVPPELPETSMARE